MNYTNNYGEKTAGRRYRMIFIFFLVTALILSTVGCKNKPADDKYEDTSTGGADTNQISGDTDNQPSEGTGADSETDESNPGDSYFKDRLDKYAADYKSGTERDALISPAILIADVKGDGKADFILEGAVGGYPNSSYAFFDNISIVEKIQGGYTDVISVSKHSRNIAFIRKDCKEVVLLSYYALDDGAESGAELALYIAKIKKENNKWISEVLIDEAVSLSEYETYFTESFDGEYIFSETDSCKAVIESVGITIGDDFKSFNLSDAKMFFPDVAPDSDDYKSYDIKADISAYLSENGLL